MVSSFDNETFFSMSGGPWFHTASINLSFSGPIDGQWSEWTAWSSCDSTCGMSSRFRSHSCDNPAPENGGDYCPGPWNETEICNVDPCPVDGNWAPWSAWWTCTKSCGGGSQTHTRTCTNPAPVWGGLDCGGESEETTGCNTNPCPSKCLVFILTL